MLKVHFIQHVAFEAPGLILSWAENNKYLCTKSVLMEGDKLPQAKDFDLLVIMGGPMSANDDEEYSWLSLEKELVRECLELKKPMVGICLGAQIIANVLGSKVYRAKEKEIGWFPITAASDIASSKLMPELPPELTVFHWHGETFDLPSGAQLLASTKTCTNQAFEFGNHVLGLQFHMEVTPEDVNSMWENCKSDLGVGDYQQGPPAIFGSADMYESVRKPLERALERLVEGLEGRIHSPAAPNLA